MMQGLGDTAMSLNAPPTPHLPLPYPPSQAANDELSLPALPHPPPQAVHNLLHAVELVHDVFRQVGSGNDALNLIRNHWDLCKVDKGLGWL